MFMPPVKTLKWYELFLLKTAKRGLRFSIFQKIKNFRPCEGAKVMFRGTTLVCSLAP